MDLGHTPELTRFRDDLRAWLAGNTIVQAEDEPEALFLKRWHQTLFGGGCAAVFDPAEDDWMRRYLYSRGASIYGGAHQVQLSILAQRVLGLPSNAVRA